MPDIYEMILLFIFGLLSFFLVWKNKKYLALEKRLDELEKNITDKINRHDRTIFREIQSYLDILNTLNIDKEIPELRNEWSVTANFSWIIMEEILHNKPKNIVELGSGTNSIISGYALKKNDNGKLTSFEHMKSFYSKGERKLQYHNLNRFVDIKLAELKDMEIENKVYRWYDITKFKFENKIDLLIVDGPPGHLQKKSRYPALPVLYEKLADQCKIIVDDYRRTDEIEIVEKWLDMYPEFQIQKLDTEHGMAILWR